MNLSDYFRILWRRKWIVVFTILVGVALATAATSRTTPMYTASTTLRVLTANPGLGTWQQFDASYAERLMGSYARIATSEPVLEAMMQQLGLDKPPAVTVEPVSATELVTITVEHDDPAMAASIANTLADILMARSDELYAGNSPTGTELLLERINQIDGELDESHQLYESLLSASPRDEERIAALSETISLKEQLYESLLVQYEEVRTTEELRANRVYIVEPASVPSSPSSPNRMINMLLGVAGGLALGLALVFLISHFDDHLYTLDQITTTTEMPVVGKIPTLRNSGTRLINNHSSPQMEAFRRLRANLLTVAGDAPLRTLMVTSAEPREGKSTVAANLALALVKSGRSVILIDADLRRPKLHTIFNLPNDTGLGSVLKQETNLDDALATCDIEGLHILTSGPSYEEVELLDSPQMDALLKTCVERFDITLLDTPAFLSVMDGVLLAPKVDGVLLVVRRSQSHETQVDATCQQLRHANAGLLGVIANCAGRDGDYKYYNQVARQA